jgi:hypothetical protein
MVECVLLRLLHLLGLMGFPGLELVAKEQQSLDRPLMYILLLNQEGTLSERILWDVLT